MNILFVADVSIQRVIGGAERVLFEQSTRLAQRGHSVHIVTRKLPDHQACEEIIGGVREWRYDVGQQNAISFVKTTIRNSRQLFEFLHDKYHLECINYHQPFSAFGIVQSPLSNRIKRIYTCFSFSFEEFVSRNAKPHGLLGRTLFFFNIHTRKWMEKKVLKKCEKIVVLSEFTQEKLCSTYKIPAQKISMIPGGVDLKRFQPAADRLEIRRRLSIPQEKVILFSVRNLVQRMGLDNLIFAMKEVVKAAPDVHLVLGGEGAIRNDLKALAKSLEVEDFVQFAGFVPEEDLPDYYRMADLFVLPTRELEGFGLVTLEAMASGVPVLGTPVGGTKEIIAKFDSDYLFKDTDPDSMAALIIENYCKIKEDPESWKHISHQCRQFVENNYSWEKNVDCLEAVLMQPV